MADPTQQEIQAMLDEARAARHRIIIYGARVEIRQRDRATSYSKPDLEALDAYIVELEQMLDGATPLPSRVFTMTQSGNGY